MNECVINKESFVNDLKKIGIKKGDRVFLHSSFKSIGTESGNPQKVIDAFLTILAEDGCLGMPVFPFCFSAEEPFDIDSSPSQVGIISEFFRRMKGVSRSFSPSHSVCFYGKDAEHFSRGAEFMPPYSLQGPFGKLYDFNFKIVMLGCGLAPNSMLHAIEDWARLPYMVNGKQTCYSLLDSNSNGKTYNHMPVGHRDFYLDPPECLDAKYVKLLRKHHHLYSDKVGKADVYWMYARELVDTCMKELDENPDLFLCDNSECTICVAHKIDLPPWKTQGGTLWDWIRIGRSKVNINPGIDSYVNHGYGSGILCDGILDDLHARVIVFRKKWERYALISLDLLQLSGDLMQRIKRRISERNRISEENISVCCSHNHCGPSIGAEFIWKEYDIRETSYVDELARKISGAVFEASKEVIPVKIGSTHRDVDIGIINRRVQLNDGTFTYYTRPAEQKPNGIIDKNFTMLFFKDRDNHTVAGIGHYSCHPIFTPPVHRKVTSDYPGFFSGTVEKELGEKSVVCFLQGSLGDQMPKLYSMNYRLASKAGRKLASCFLDEMNRCQYSPLNGMAWDSADHLVQNSGTNLNAHLQVLKLNDFIFAFVGGEMFVALGMDFKNRVSKEKSVLVGMANDYLAYIPTRDAFDTPTYEVTSCIEWIKGEPGIGEELIDACVELAKRVGNSNREK